MYSGCEGSTTKTRIQKLVDSKESPVSIRTVKPTKKFYVEELLHRYSYLRIKERGLLVDNKKNSDQPTSHKKKFIHYFNWYYSSFQHQRNYTLNLKWNLF